jgi:uncharacterized membrane protein YbhN (UPF0104 family)
VNDEETTRAVAAPRGVLPSRMTAKDYVWPVIGLGAVAFSVWLLYRELRGISLHDVIDSLNAISYHNWLMAAGATLLAYTALAGYDRIALLHLRRKVRWAFITLCSFTTYALAHNIGMSVMSGAVVRYRAYASQGLTIGEVGVLVAFCSFTFALGTILAGGVVLTIEPTVAERFFPDLPVNVGWGVGICMLLFVALYITGSWLNLKPLRIGRFELRYPKLPIVMQQLVVAPLEVVGAAGIIYFVLPEAGNPGFLVILGIFLASFSVALLSHAPGGIGVLEFVFLTGLPDIDPAAVLAALVVFRLFYLLIPLLLSLFVILAFERAQLFERARRGVSLPDRRSS